MFRQRFKVKKTVFVLTLALVSSGLFASQLRGSKMVLEGHGNGCGQETTGDSGGGEKGGSSDGEKKGS